MEAVRFIFDRLQNTEFAKEPKLPMKKLFFIVFTLLGVYAEAVGQDFNRLFPTVKDGESVVPQPWLGGLNCPQPSAVDLNNDGRLDLYVFDRVGNVQLTFLASGTGGATTYTYAPEFASNFPPLENWVLLRDYNGDGIADIFAYSDIPGIDGIMVWTGYYDAQNRLAFRRYNFRAPFNIIYYPLSGAGQVNLYVTKIDYPAVDDVDCDGDLDILTFSQGGGYVEFYRNYSVENKHGRDSLQFRLSTSCWGGFFESGVTEKLDLAANPGECYRQNPGNLAVGFRHSGSTILTLDSDGDGDREVVLGDVSFRNLSFLTNGGTCQQAWMNKQDNFFPSSDFPVDLPVFPAAFSLDVDQDGRMDMLVAPNATSGAESYEALWYYRNTGTSTAPDYKLQRRNFLIDQTLDFGTGAHPAWVDVNADGLLDLVVGNGTFYGDLGLRDSRLFLFQNVGTAQEPAFALVNDDWLTMSQFNNVTYNFTPTFGDLDNDGDLDLLIGEEFGRLFHAENIADPGKPMQFSPVEYGYKGIDVGLASTPQLFDLNSDGRIDLIIGERNGNVNFFPNQGTPGKAEFVANPALAPNIERLGMINTNEPGYVTGFSAPLFFRTAEGIQAIVGSEAGGLYRYTQIEGQLEGIFNLVTDTWGDIRPGSLSRPALADINSDGRLDLVIGNERGGLTLWTTPLQAIATGIFSPAPTVKQLAVYPNPAQREIFLSWPQGAPLSNVQVELRDLQGRVVYQSTQPGNQQRLMLPQLPGGLYLLRAQAGNELYVARVVISG